MSEHLLEKAELLMEIEGYEQESMKKSENAIIIKASKSDSDETTLIYIVTSNTIGTNQVKTITQMLEEEDVDKLIVFAKKFTTAVKKKLNEEDIGFFSEDMGVLSLIPPGELYSKVIDYVNRLCQIKCGHTPKSASECKGYSEDHIICSNCEGSGKIDGWNRFCKTCGGTGFRNQHYSCKVRLISDNADYHQGKRWLSLLQNDLLSLIKIIHIEGNEDDSVDHVSSHNLGEVN